MSDYLTLGNVGILPPAYQSTIGKIRKFRFDYENPYSGTPLLYIMQFWLCSMQLRLYNIQLWLYSMQLRFYISQFLLITCNCDYTMKFRLYISQLWLYYMHLWVYILQFWENKVGNASLYQAILILKKCNYIRNYFFFYKKKKTWDSYITHILFLNSYFFLGQAHKSKFNLMISELVECCTKHI